MATNTSQSLRIDMVSDVVCPWCAIGYQRLQKALKAFPELTVALHFQPFELNPQMPKQGQNVNEHIAQKYGASEATIEQNRKNLKMLGIEEGVNFNGNSQSKIYNTFLAHKLLLKAEELASQKKVKLALLKANFEEQKNISDPKILLDIAVQNGFTEDQALLALGDHSLSKRLRERQQQFVQMGISAVPTFIFNHQYTVSGAQDANVLENVIRDTLRK